MSTDVRNVPLMYGPRVIADRRRKQSPIVPRSGQCCPEVCTIGGFDRIHPDLLLHRLIKDRDLLAQLPPGGEQRTHDQGDIGSAVEQRFDPMIKSEPPDGASEGEGFCAATASD